MPPCIIWSLVRMTIYIPLTSNKFCTAVGQPPWIARSQFELANTVRNTELDTRFGNSHVNSILHMKNLIKKMLHKDPGTRMSMEEVYIHPFVTNEGCEFLDSVDHPPPMKAINVDIRGSRDDSHVHHESMFSVFSDDSFRSAASSPSKASFRSASGRTPFVLSPNAAAFDAISLGGLNLSRVPTPHSRSQTTLSRANSGDSPLGKEANYFRPSFYEQKRKKTRYCCLTLVLLFNMDSLT